MMRRNDFPGFRYGTPFLLFLLLLLCFFGIRHFNFHPETVEPQNEERFFVQVCGGVRAPGVYGFEKAPELKNLLECAGGFLSAEKNLKKESFSPKTRTFTSGKAVEVVEKGESWRFIEKDMPAFYRITLGLPVYLNRETLEGLSAVPGIGPKLAKAIVNCRTRIGGFAQVEDILSVPGIGPHLYEKIRPYLDL